MRVCLFYLLLLPRIVTAQELDMGGAYRAALTAFLQAHPKMVYTADSLQMVFLKNHGYLASVGDTVAGVELIYIELAGDRAQVMPHFPGKRKRIVLDVQQMWLQDTITHVWILPVRARFPKDKSKSVRTRYTGMGCLSRYAYAQEQTKYLYRGFSCKKF